MESPDQEPLCRVCGSGSIVLGHKVGRFKPDTFEIRSCPDCGLVFVANPWREYSEIYDEAYYEGRGADPLVSYDDEIADPRTVRVYEWRGVLQVVDSLVSVGPSTRWLDFGCGLGGLVRYVREARGVDACGHDEGWAAERLRETGVPLLEREAFGMHEGAFDVVTAIEVVEHVERPVEVLRSIRSLLKPGGVLFLTTGNAAPHVDDIMAWPYLIPEIHISLYLPRTLETALSISGFRPEYPGFAPGYEDIIRYKVLKSLRMKRTGATERLVPWSLASRIVDHRHRVTDHPIGRA